jgi:hypothetical protein
MNDGVAVRADRLQVGNGVDLMLAFARGQLNFVVDVNQLKRQAAVSLLQVGSANLAVETVMRQTCLAGLGGALEALHGHIPKRSLDESVTTLDHQQVFVGRKTMVLKEDSKRQRGVRDDQVGGCPSTPTHLMRCEISWRTAVPGTKRWHKAVHEFRRATIARLSTPIRKPVANHPTSANDGLIDIAAALPATNQVDGEARKSFTGLCCESVPCKDREQATCARRQLTAHVALHKHDSHPGLKTFPPPGPWLRRRRCTAPPCRA